MVDAAPFAAVRYDPRVTGDAGSTSAPAYDDVEPLDYARHRTASPYTVLELLAGGGGDAGGYGAAGQALERWRRTGVLITEPRPAYYRYEIHELRSGAPTLQRGILAAVRVTNIGAGGEVLAHEAIDPARVIDRIERLSTVPIDVSPVFSLYEGNDDALTELLARPAGTRPVVTAGDPDGTDHRIWAIDDPDEIAAVRTGLADRRVVIADGHHRYATAVAFAQRQASLDGATAAGPDGAGLGAPPWARTLMYLVDTRAHGPRVEPIHRVADGLAPDLADRLARLTLAQPRPADPAALARAVADRTDGSIGWLAHDGSAGLLQLRDRAALAARLPPTRSSTWRALSSALLDHGLLPALGATSITPHSDPVAAAAQVRETPRSALFLLPPVAASTIMALADAGEPMPPKTTSFRPKPRTGLILRDVLPSSRPGRGS